jgi:sulfate adenylyltransferase large subunit
MRGGPQSLLRFITCGSVDDGKSTLIGRLLYDTRSVPTDHLTVLSRDSKKYGTQGEAYDFALLVDGLAAEREQGITIDVAYRYFATPRRAFIVADTPGHEQYTRNMATGASTAELAIILMDAQKGILAQTRRHSFIAAMLGVRHIVLAVNKMDLIGFDKAAFDAIVGEYRRAIAGLGFASVTCIPVCARDGDNVAQPSHRMEWYEGPTLLEHLETADIGHERVTGAPFRLPVQWVNRPTQTFRGYAGTVASGTVRPGDAIMVLPAGQRSRIARIVTADGDLDHAVEGQAVTLTLETEIDVSRGDVIVAADDSLAAHQELQVQLLWMAEPPLEVGRSYALQIGTATANARVAALHHAIDIRSFAARPASSLAVNEIGLVSLQLDRPVVATRYAEDRELGGIILIDRLSNQTAALGMVESGDRAASEARRKDHHLRSLVKAASWRLAGSLDTFALSWIITGRPMIAGSIAGTEVFTKIALFYLHERAWEFLPWGRRYAKPAGSMVSWFSRRPVASALRAAFSKRD